jgi:hypothetical protein
VGQSTRAVCHFRVIIGTKGATRLALQDSAQSPATPLARQSAALAQNERRGAPCSSNRPWSVPRTGSVTGGLFFDQGLSFTTCEVFLRAKPANVRGNRKRWATRARSAASCRKVGVPQNTGSVTVSVRLAETLERLRLSPGFVFP